MLCCMCLLLEFGFLQDRTFHMIDLSVRENRSNDDDDLNVELKKYRAMSAVIMKPRVSASSGSSPDALSPGSSNNINNNSYDELINKDNNVLLNNVQFTSSSSLHSTSSFSSIGYECDADVIKFGADKTPKALEQKQTHKQFWRFVVMMICIVWSTNFAVIKGIFAAVPTLDASLYTAIRFVIAGVVMLPNTARAWSKPILVCRCIVMGFFVFLGYFGQGMGMSLGSSANTSAFICSMNCVWIALLQVVVSFVFKAQTWLSILLAVFGVAILELQGSDPIALGDYWLILQPIGFGTGYVLLESLMRDYPEEATAITSFKLLVIAVCSTIWALANGKSIDDLEPFLNSRFAIIGILYCALFTTVAAIWCQSIAFKKVSAIDVSIILCTEPVWATLFSACTYEIILFSLFIVSILTLII